MPARLFDQPLEDLCVDWYPLLLYGESGAGKSYCALSLADRWRAAFDTEPLVTNAPDLTRLFVPKNVTEAMGEWSNIYRNSPLLVIDDLHHLTHKQMASDWLASVLDYRKHHSLPSIFSISSIDDLRGLDRRLASRLINGLALRVSLPLEQTRSHLIELFANNFSIELSHFQMQALTARTDGMSVAGIWNAVRSVCLGEFTIESSDHQNNALKETDFAARCIRTVARRFGVRVSDLKSSSRRKNCVLARSIAMFLIREAESLTLADVGRLFQNRDHTTVRHACQKIRHCLFNDRATQDAVRSICTSLKMPVSPSWFRYPKEECA